MNLNSLLEVLNANKDDKFVVSKVKGKVVASNASATQVIVTVVKQPNKNIDTVANVLAMLKKLDVAATGTLEVFLNDKALASVAADEGYVTCKVS